MRRLSRTVTLVGTTALTLPLSLSAHAHDGFTATRSFEAAQLDLRTPLNAEVYQAFLDVKLDKIEALVNATQAKVAAIPSTKVLSGIERRIAKVRLARAATLGAMLDKLPDSGALAPTAAQQAQIARIRADLKAIVAKLKTLLANQPVVVKPTSTTVKPVSDLKVLGTWWGKDGCDGRHRDGDGWRDGDRDRNWDGWRSWDGWRR